VGKLGRTDHLVNGDFIFLVACLGFSLVMLGVTHGLEKMSAMVPRLFGTLGIIFSSVAIVIRLILFLRGGERQKEPSHRPSKTLEGAKVEGAMNLYVAILLAIVYLALAEVLGFVVGTVIMIFAYLWFAHYRRVGIGLIYSIVTSLLLYWLFYKILRVNLPEGVVPWPWKDLL
jgi:hypothetical protein